jgi:predicted aspartyl protease
LHKNIVPGMLLIYVLLFPAPSLPHEETKDCRLKQYASINLLQIRNGYLLVPVTIQDSQAFMVLNTASAFSSITENAANRLELQTKPMPLGLKANLGNQQIAKIATVRGLSLGNLQFKTLDLTIISNDTIGANQVDGRAIGILGMDLLAHVDIELDAANLKMNLFSQDHCPGRAVYWSKAYDSVPIRFGKLGEFYFPMELEGKKLETTLATGSPTTTVSTDATRKLYDFDSHSSDVEVETDAAGRTTAHYRAMKLSGEGIQIINARITLIDRPQNDSCHLGSRSGAAAYEGCLGIHPLQLGRNVLEKLHLYIATKEKVLYFTAAGAS